MEKRKRAAGSEADGENRPIKKRTTAGRVAEGDSSAVSSMRTHNGQSVSPIQPL